VSSGGGWRWRPATAARGEAGGEIRMRKRGRDAQGNDSLNEAEGVGLRSLSCCVTEKYGRWSPGAWAAVGMLSWAWL
jgi:hypothetical protein